MEELIAHYKHGYFATAETYEPIVRWIKMAVKLHDIMLDNNIDLSTMKERWSLCQ